jgi:hypothetical protein
MTSPIENTMNYLSSLKEDFVANMIFFIILILVITLLCYFFYVKNLEAGECSAMGSLYKSLDGNLRSINPSDPQFGNSLKDYYIKTAYNACSGGSYKNDFVDLCHLKSVISQGVRGLDFEIYSLNDEPIVATSTDDNYFIKETYNYVKFSEVMYMIKNYSFANSTAPNPKDPIIIHLRFKSSNQNMYDNLALLLESYDSLMLGKEYSYQNHMKNLGDVPLIKLLGSIVIIVDTSSRDFLENKAFLEYVNMTSNSMFMRALRYIDVKETPDVNELIRFNKSNMTIALPDVGANPPNMSGLLVRQTGSQMLAMRYQLNDLYLKENNTFFDNAGYAFVLKPQKLFAPPAQVVNVTPQDPALSYETRVITGKNYSFKI